MGALLAMLFGLAAAGAAFGAPDADALASIRPLRLSDPPAFIAAVRRFEASTAPADLEVRDTLALMSAQALALEGRFGEALDKALHIADGASTAGTRHQADALAVQVLAATGEFLEGQKRLDPLIAEVERQGDPALRRHIGLVAAIFYNQVSQYELAQQHAEQVLALEPGIVERCVASVQSLDARQQRFPKQLPEQAFLDAAAVCDAAGGGLMRAYLDVGLARWLSGQGRPEAAADLLRERMPAITAIAYPRLLAEAHAQRAESLQHLGRLDEAEREASAALDLSADLATGKPLLLARRALYEVALRRGDSARALRELQAVVTAERAYAEEVQRMQAAYQAGRREGVLRQQEAALLDERNTQLRLEAERSAGDAARLRLFLAPAALGLVALVVWAWRSRARQRRLRQLMQVDTLTGLWTRAHFTQIAAAALAVAERQAQPMALVLFDLDHFSQVNSRHGHLSGDRLLVAVAKSLRGLETTDVHFGRLGGEEFAALLPGASLDEGLSFAERCREAIAGTQATAYDERTPMQVTGSFGVVSTTAAGYRLRDLLANADQALYRAKSAGRNRVAAAVVVPVSDGAAA